MEWIDIKKHKPEHGQICRIKTKNGNEAIAPCSRLQDGSCSFSYREIDQVTEWLYITHWMPWPESSES